MRRLVIPSAICGTSASAPPAHEESLGIPRRASPYITSTSPSAQCYAMACKPVKKIPLRYGDSASHSKPLQCPAARHFSLVMSRVRGSNPLVGSSQLAYLNHLYSNRGGPSACRGVSFDTTLIPPPATEGGREMALRYAWDPRIQEFVPRPGVRKLILLVDGTWREGDLDALARAGWGVITHPNEIAKLVEAVVWQRRRATTDEDQYVIRYWAFSNLCRRMVTISAAAQRSIDPPHRDKPSET